MQTRQRDVAALDAKYTGELADAKETIERLHSDVIAGRKRLQFAQTVPRTERPTPAAWMMLPPPNSLQTLDKIISISESN